jgi:transposase-like protein
MDGMNCVRCGSEAVTQRSEITAQGYRRFRCRDRGRQFNERSGGMLNRTSLPSDIIAFVVFCRDCRKFWGVIPRLSNRNLLPNRVVRLT